jgi:hypothetical protein
MVVTRALTSWRIRPSASAALALVLTFGCIFEGEPDEGAARPDGDAAADAATAGSGGAAGEPSADANGGQGGATGDASAEATTGAGGTASGGSAGGPPADASAGSGGVPAGGAAATDAATDQDLCKGQTDGVHCGSDLSSSAIQTARYFCSKGSTLGIADCASGCKVGACIDPGGGSTGSGGKVQACSACLQTNCSSEKAQCEASEDCEWLLRCFQSCDKTAGCKHACEQHFAAGAESFQPLAKCAAAKCKVSC